MAASAETLITHDSYAGKNRYQYEFDNITTSLAETLDGSMRARFDFNYSNGELYGHDGTPLGKIFRDSILDAEQITTKDPNLQFELRRRYLELDEYKDMLAMASNELPNTMIAVSDFPLELMTAHEDVGGYNVTRKQTMLRVITRNPDNTLEMTIQSLDLSDRSALEAIYAHYGITPQPGELLGQRIYCNTPPEDQPYVIDQLTGVYDRSLTEQYGGNWYAGRQNEPIRDTYAFTLRQTDLINYFVNMRLNNPDQAEAMLYGIKATMQERYKAQNIPIQQDSAQNIHYINVAVQQAFLEQEIIQAGQRATALGIVFSSCGQTQQATYEQTREAGYGNKTNDTTQYKFDKIAFCNLCQKPPKQDEKPKKCGPCNICEDCVKQKYSNSTAA